MNDMKLRFKLDEAEWQKPIEKYIVGYKKSGLNKEKEQEFDSIPAAVKFAQELSDDGHTVTSFKQITNYPDYMKRLKISSDWQEWRRKKS